MADVTQRLDDLERRLRFIEESLEMLTTRITCENGEIIVTGPLSVPIKEPTKVIARESVIAITPS